MPQPSQRTALYRLFDSSEALLYVGISNLPENRFRQHHASKEWWSEVDGITVEWFDTRYGASKAETQAILTEQPRHNIMQTDAWRAQQSATARRITPEKRRNRSIGLKARNVQVRTMRELTLRGVPTKEAAERALLARERYIEAARHSI